MSDKLRDPKDGEDVLFDLAKLEKLANEPRDLKNEPGTALCDYLDLVFGAAMILAPAAAIIMMIFAKAGWGAYLAGVVLFFFCLMVGGKMIEEAWKNLKKRGKNG